MKIAFSPVQRVTNEGWLCSWGAGLRDRKTWLAPDMYRLLVVGGLVPSELLWGTWSSKALLYNRTVLSSIHYVLL